MISHRTVNWLLLSQLVRNGGWQQPVVHHRKFSHNAWDLPNIHDVAILGGGVTGLAAAYYLSKSLPATSRIALFEASPRLGGWLNSTSVDVGNGKVVFESGPRSLRPGTVNGLVALDLIAQLQLQNRIITTPKSSPAARNRFIYYPDHLVRMPGPGAGIFENIRSIWSEPVFDGAISEVLSEVSRPRRPESVTDESIGSFLSRRFGPVIADNLASAVFHGIYAGDIYKLSARTIIPSQWQMEGRHSSIVRSAFEFAFGAGRKPMNHEDWELLSHRSSQLPQAWNTHIDIKNTSVYTFAGGLSEIAKRLEVELQEKSNVHLYKGTAVDSIELQKDQQKADQCNVQDRGPMLTTEQILIHTSNTGTRKQYARYTFSHAIATFPSKILANLIGVSRLSKTLQESSTVTVMVINLFYKNSELIPARGFGYLIPRSLPFEQNPEAALGVIFDSDATPGQDNVEGTKVTVILGGHWWSDWDTYPNEEQGARMARKVLQRHLHIAEAPSACRVTMQRDCIPQYTLGHDDRMGKVSEDLQVLYGGKLRVAGNSYSGVGVNDCIRAARDVAHGLVSGSDKTGLDSFREGKKWRWISREESKLI